MNESAWSASEPRLMGDVVAPRRSGARRVGVPASVGVVDRVRLVADADEELEPSTLEAEFPSVRVLRAHELAGDEIVIDDFAWRGAFDFRPFDELVDDARPLHTVAIRGVDAVGVAMEVLGRYQRHVMRRNTSSGAALFDAVLEMHAAVFDSGRRIDRDHALDTWQWMLRLAPSVGLAAQVAALFHEIDRLGENLEERLEHRAHRAGPLVPRDRGRERVLARLQDLGLSADDVALVRDLILGRAATTPDAALLDDADELSFLSLMSAEYADRFGVAQTRRKLVFTLGRMGPVARSKLAFVRLRPDLARLVDAVGPRDLAQA